MKLIAETHAKRAIKGFLFAFRIRLLLFPPLSPHMVDSTQEQEIIRTPPIGGSSQDTGLKQAFSGHNGCFPLDGPVVPTGAGRRKTHLGTLGN